MAVIDDSEQMAGRHHGCCKVMSEEYSGRRLSVTDGISWRG